MNVMEVKSKQAEALVNAVKHSVPRRVIPDVEIEVSKENVLKDYCQDHEESVRYLFDIIQKF